MRSLRAMHAGPLVSFSELSSPAGRNSLRTGHAPTVGLWGPVSPRNAGLQNVDSSRQSHTFTSAHSEWNEAEIHCLRRPGGRDENRSFMNMPAARSKLAVSSAEWFRQAVKVCGCRLLHIAAKTILFGRISRSSIYLIFTNRLSV